MTSNQPVSTRRLLGLAAVALLVSGVNAGDQSAIKDLPHLASDNASKRFLAERLAIDSKVYEGKNTAAESFDDYATRLAEVLATFTPEQQRRIFYGH